jgi:hypothetical protein
VAETLNFKQVLGSFTLRNQQRTVLFSRLSLSHSMEKIKIRFGLILQLLFMHGQEYIVLYLFLILYSAHAYFRDKTRKFIGWWHTCMYVTLFNINCRMNIIKHWHICFKSWWCLDFTWIKLIEAACQMPSQVPT